MSTWQDRTVQCPQCHAKASLSEFSQPVLTSTDPSVRIEDRLAVQCPSGRHRFPLPKLKRFFNTDEWTELLFIPTQFDKINHGDATILILKTRWCDSCPHYNEEA